jgi:glycine dehydrogenase subunit 1
VGLLILARSAYAAQLLDAIPGVELRWPDGFFKEFVVNFDSTGKTVSAINAALRERHIFGGKDLSAELPEFGQSALYCVTEVHSAEDLRRLADVLEEVLT